MDQVRRFVEEGKILNYDACIQYPQIWGIAAQRKLPGDDAAMNQTRKDLCTNFYNNGTWRGGISPAIDDRKSVDANEWTVEKRRQVVRVRNDIKANFANNVKVLRTRAGAAALDFPGAKDEVDNAKRQVETLTGSISTESNRLQSFVAALQAKQSKTLVDEVSNTELKVRNLEKENQVFANLSSLRKEQADSLYNKYEGNYHSSFFGYMPLHESSRSAILTTALFMGLLALILIGLKIAPSLVGIQVPSFGVPSFGTTTAVAPVGQEKYGINTSFLRRGRGANISRF